MRTTPRELHLYYNPDNDTADLVVVLGPDNELSLLGPTRATSRHAETGADVNHIIATTAAVRNDAGELRYVREPAPHHPGIAA